MTITCGVESTSPANTRPTNGTPYAIWKVNSTVQENLRKKESITHQANPSIAKISSSGVAYHDTGVPLDMGQTDLPNRWSPRYTFNGSSRSADVYNMIIDQFIVAGRYLSHADGRLFCDLFVQDVTAAMGVPLLGSAYSMARHLPNAAGWTEFPPRIAQNMANEGYLTIAAWENFDGYWKSGHVAIVRPEREGHVFTEYDGPIIANAGRDNFDYGTIRQGFGNHINQTLYFAHGK